MDDCDLKAHSLSEGRNPGNMDLHSVDMTASQRVTRHEEAIFKAPEVPFGRSLLRQPRLSASFSWILCDTRSLVSAVNLDGLSAHLPTSIQ